MKYLPGYYIAHVSPRIHIITQHNYTNGGIEFHSWNPNYTNLEGMGIVAIWKLNKLK